MKKVDWTKWLCH